MNLTKAFQVITFGLSTSMSGSTLAATVYAVQWGSDNVYKIDGSTGVILDTFSGPGSTTMNAMCAAADGRILIGGDSQSLFIFNPKTGLFEKSLPLSGISSQISIRSLALLSEDRIWATVGDAGSGIYEINASTGAGTLVRRISSALPQGLARDPVNDIVYQARGIQIDTVDQVTGAPTFLTITDSFIGFQALDVFEGSLYGAEGSKIYKMNLSDGKIQSSLTVSGMSSIRGIYWIPEPSVSSLALISAITVLCSRQRANRISWLNDSQQKA